MFGGIQFRSRLEARWAAFFNNIGWKYTYEPFDGDGYIPDFVIHGDSPLLVEVKPAVTRADFFDPVGKVESGLADVWRHDILIVGADPIPDIDEYADRTASHPAAGLVGQFWPSCSSGSHWTDPSEPSCRDCNAPTKPGWNFGTALWFNCLKCDTVNVHHSIQMFTGQPCGHYDGDGYLGHIDATVIESAWSSACNQVRWSSR